MARLELTREEIQVIINALAQTHPIIKKISEQAAPQIEQEQMQGNSHDKMDVPGARGADHPPR